MGALPCTLGGAPRTRVHARFARTDTRVTRHAPSRPFARPQASSRVRYTVTRVPVQRGHTSPTRGWATGAQGRARPGLYARSRAAVARPSPCTPARGCPPAPFPFAHAARARACPAHRGTAQRCLGAAQTRRGGESGAAHARSAAPTTVAPPAARRRGARPHPLATAGRANGGLAPGVDWQARGRWGGVVVVWLRPLPARSLHGGGGSIFSRFPQRPARLSPGRRRKRERDPRDAFSPPAPRSSLPLRRHE